MESSHHSCDLLANCTLTAVQGLAVGHWTDLEAATGCTVVLCPQGVTAAVDVRGSAPATRETDALDPVNLVHVAHAIVITGGSAFGLSVADGVAEWLENHGHGMDMHVARVPIVPSAALFDLAVGRADVRPGPRQGYAACEAATTAPVEEGCVGAGTGATVGKLGGLEWATKSGLGSAAVRVPNGPTVGAVVAVNAFGDVVDPTCGRVLAGLRAAEGGYLSSAAQLRKGVPMVFGGLGQNTTLAVVATDAVLSNVEATKVARMAHDGLARAIDPVHTRRDGDAVFCLATGTLGETADTSAIGALAAGVLAEAVVRAVEAATPLAGLPAASQIDGGSCQSGR
jgi:L-aminopeptidase/D-esterase-like protein